MPVMRSQSRQALVRGQVSRPLFLLAIAAVPMLICCADDGGDKKVSFWESISDSTAWLTITDAEDVCLDCIEVTPVVTLGEDDGPGAIMESQFVAVDGRGQYWVSQPDGPMVFSSAGEFIRQVGRRGQGPGEFLRPTLVHTDSGGRVHVFDIGNLRETVFNPDLTLALERSVTAAVHATAALPGLDDYVANLTVPSPDLFGVPLHIVKDGALAVSFGATEFTGPHELARKVAVDTALRVYAGKPNQYEIEIWSKDGRRIIGLRRPDAWPVPTAEELGPFAPDKPPIGQLFDIRPSGEDRLWVIYWLPKSDWREHLTEVITPDGRILYRPARGIESLYESHIELIDLRQGRVLTRTATENVVGNFLSDQLMYGPHLTAAGAPRVVVSQVHMNALSGEG